MRPVPQTGCMPGYKIPDARALVRRYRSLHPGRAQDRLHGGLIAAFGVDHQIVEIRVAPLLLEILPDARSAQTIIFPNHGSQIGWAQWAGAPPFRDALLADLDGRVEKHVKNVRPAVQDALAAAAYHHAVA